MSVCVWGEIGRIDIMYDQFMDLEETEMDLRVEKTEKAIKNAFIELRARKPLEKITVKELCALACINKSTFYSHYTDIYALSEAIEKETVTSIINSIENLEEYSLDTLDEFTRAMSIAFMSQRSLIRILFSGKEQNHLGQRMEQELKRVIFRKYPDHKTNIETNIFLSFCIQGSYHAFLNNPEADGETFVKTIEKIVKCLQTVL